jgi:hypothetical protein
MRRKATKIKENLRIRIGKGKRSIGEKGREKPGVSKVHYLC